jgi:hypothetical protein
MEKVIFSIVFLCPSNKKETILNLQLCTLHLDFERGVERRAFFFLENKVDRSVLILISMRINDACSYPGQYKNWKNRADVRHNSAV